MKISNALDLGRMIKERRVELGYTQGYISEITGFSVSFLSQLENGKETAELGKAIYLINLLGLDMHIDVR